MDAVDLARPPYARYRALLAKLRASRDAWPRLAFEAARDDDRGAYDTHETDRQRVVHLLHLDWRPADLGLARWLLAQEIAARRADSFQGAGDALTMLSLRVLEASDPEDGWLFWQAKRANFDTWAGGYDIEFVVAALGAERAASFLVDHGDADAIDGLENYDLDEIEATLPRWLARMRRGHPDRLTDFDAADFEVLADVFDDLAGVERYGLVRAESAEQRARIFERVGKLDAALACWRLAADEAGDAWDRISRLTSAMKVAATAGEETIDEAVAIDGLRHEIELWAEVGLGRIATETCFRLAAAVDDEATGRRLWRLASSWNEGLARFSLVGLEAALDAARRWGSPDEIAAIEQAVCDERARIDAMF